MVVQALSGLPSLRRLGLSVLRSANLGLGVKATSRNGQTDGRTNIINPRRAHALARVTVVGLCVCLSAH